MSVITQAHVDQAFNQLSADSRHNESDCERIAEVIKNNYDVVITATQAEQIWGEHSDSLCAGWLYVNDDDEIMSAFNSFIMRRVDV